MIRLATLSPRQVAVLRVFEASHGVLTEAQFRQLDQRPCRGLGTRVMIARPGANRFVWSAAAREALRTYDQLDVFRRLESMPLSSLFEEPAKRRLHVLPRARASHAA